MGAVAHNAHRKFDGIGMDGLAGGDGIEARREAGQDAEELLGGRDGSGKVCDEVDELAAPAVLVGEQLVLWAAEPLERLWARPPTPAAAGSLAYWLTVPRASLPMASHVRRASAKLIWFL